jgi:hypothetical protein
MLVGPSLIPTSSAATATNTIATTALGRIFTPIYVLAEGENEYTYTIKNIDTKTIKNISYQTQEMINKGKTSQTIQQAIQNNQTAIQINLNSNITTTQIKFQDTQKKAIGTVQVISFTSQTDMVKAIDAQEKA